MHRTGRYCGCAELSPKRVRWTCPSTCLTTTFTTTPRNSSSDRSTDDGPLRTAQTGLQPVRTPCGPADRLQAVLQDPLLDRNRACRRAFRLRQEPLGAAVRDGRLDDGTARVVW